jgi:septation ring formation regulator EzrA
VSLGLLGAIKLIKALNELTDVSSPLIDGIKELYIKRSYNRKESDRINDLEKALSMQATLNEQYGEQIKVIQSTLEKIEKSLKLSIYGLIGAIAISVAAIIIAVLK